VGDNLTKMRTDAEANLAALIESTEDLIWSVDLNYGLLTFNRAFHDNIQRNFGIRSRWECGRWTCCRQSERHYGPHYTSVCCRRGPSGPSICWPMAGPWNWLSTESFRMVKRRAFRCLEGHHRTKDGGEETAGCRETIPGHIRGGARRIYRATFEGSTLVANPAMAGMLGYESAQEVVSMITDSVNQVWLDRMSGRRFLQMLEQHETVRGFECQWKRKDGEAIWVSLSSRKVCGKDGGALYVEGFIEDITERKRMQDALRKSEEQFERYFGAVPSPRCWPKSRMRAIGSSMPMRRLNGSLAIGVRK